MTIGHDTHAVPEPFLVMATQNPIESEGTYPLPEAQVDRFMLKVLVGYPERDEELTVVNRSLEDPVVVRQVLPADRARGAAAVRSRTSTSTRGSSATPSASPRRRASRRRSASTSSRSSSPTARARAARSRSSQSARALALIHGRDYVIPGDIRALVKDAFRHRLVLTYQALAEERSADDVLDAVIAAVPQPRLELGRPAAA